MASITRIAIVRVVLRKKKEMHVAFAYIATGKGRELLKIDNGD